METHTAKAYFLGWKGKQTKVVTMESLADKLKKTRQDMGRFSETGFVERQQEFYKISNALLLKENSENE